MYDFLRDENLQDSNVRHNLLAMDKQLCKYKDGHEHAGGFIFLFSPHTNRTLVGLRAPYAYFEPNKWNPLGGTMETNECPLLAAMREVYEEGHILPSQYKLEPNIFHLDLNDDDKGNTHRVYMYLGIVDDEVEPTIDHEHADAQWIDINELSQMPLFLPLQRALLNPKSLQMLKKVMTHT